MDLFAVSKVNILKYFSLLTVVKISVYFYIDLFFSHPFGTLLQCTKPRFFFDKYISDTTLLPGVYDVAFNHVQTDVSKTDSVPS